MTLTRGALDGSAYAPSKRHSEGFNASFCDAHGKWVKTQSLVSPAYGDAACLYHSL